MKPITVVMLATAAVAQLPPVRLSPTASVNVTNIANVHLAEGAVELIQSQGIWVPDVNNLTNLATSFEGNFTQLAIYLDSIVNMDEEVKKYNASGLNADHLFSITPKNISTEDIAIKDAPNGYGVDCAHCHLCEEACIATIWFPPFLWLCEGLCQLQSWCHHCD